MNIDYVCASATSFRVLLVGITLAIVLTMLDIRPDTDEEPTCPTCQECGYRLPGLELIDSVETVTDKETLRAIAMAETRGRHYVVIRGAKGEVGMGQINPIHGDECYGIGDVSLPENNIRCTDLIYQNCLRKTNGDRKAALCCYNGSALNENGSCDYAKKVGER